MSAFPPKIVVYLPKCLMTSFFSHRPFSCLNVVFFHRGGQIRSRHRYGGAKILNFRQIHNAIITLSAPEGGGKLYCQLRWGAMAGFASPGSATDYGLSAANCTIFNKSNPSYELDFVFIIFVK